MARIVPFWVRVWVRIRARVGVRVRGTGWVRTTPVR